MVVSLLLYFYVSFEAGIPDTGARLKMSSPHCKQQELCIRFTLSGPRLNIKAVFPGCGDSHVKDKTVARPSYLWNGDPYTGKTTSYIETDPWCFVVRNRPMFYPHPSSLPHMQLGESYDPIILFAWRRQATGQTSVELSSEVLCGIHLKAVSQVFMNVIYDMSPEITHLKLQPYSHRSMT